MYGNPTVDFDVDRNCSFLIEGMKAGDLRSYPSQGLETL